MSLKNIFYELVSLRDRLRTAVVATGIEADSSVSLNQLAGMLETQVSEGGGGGSSAFDLVKVTGHTTTHEAYSAITQIVVSGLVEDQEMGVDFSLYNGTYLPTSDTAAETDPLKRIYKHSTSNRWIKHYVWDPEETGEGTGYWLMVSNLSYGMWDADLSKTSNDQPLASGTANWENMDYGMTQSVTLAVTTTNFPAETWSLTVQKIASCTTVNHVKTFSSDGVDISLSASDIPIIMGSMAIRDSTNEKLIQQVSDSTVIGIPTDWVYSNALDSLTGWDNAGGSLVLDSDINKNVFALTGNSNRIFRKDLDSTGFLPYFKNTRSMSFWAKRTASVSNGWSGIGYGNGRENGVRFAWGIKNNYPVFTAWGVDYFQESYGEISDTNWHHYLLTLSGGNTVKLYMDGTLTWTWTTTGINTKIDVIQIGDPYETQYAPIARFSTLRIYNRLLTAQEIAALAAEFTPTA